MEHAILRLRPSINRSSRDEVQFNLVTLPPSHNSFETPKVPEV